MMNAFYYWLIVKDNILLDYSYTTKPTYLGWCRLHYTFMLKTHYIHYFPLVDVTLIACLDTGCYWWEEQFNNAILGSSV